MTEEMEVFDDKTLKIRELLNIAFELADAMEHEFGKGELQLLTEQLLELGFTSEELEEGLSKTTNGRLEA